MQEVAYLSVKNKKIQTFLGYLSLVSIGLQSVGIEHTIHRLILESRIFNSFKVV